MNREIKQQIFDKIKEYDRIVISRHFRPDGDAMGSTKGLATLIRATYPDKEVYLVNEDYSEYLTFLGGEDSLPDEGFEGALQIVIDTATVSRISNKRYSLAKELIKIDHHVDIAPYGDISWVEDKRSSACEMIADFWDTFRDEWVMTPEAATYIYTGMVTDSGRFRFRDVSGETLRLAGLILSQGVDTEALYANLYLEDFASLQRKGYFIDKLQITENGVAYLYVDRAMQEQFGMSGEAASALVSTMDSIKGSIVWAAFIDNADGSIRVRLRSRFMTINKLAERYNGGGHECAAGATVYSAEEMNKLIQEADALVGEYKATHEGWI